ncbi:hypothetical protein PoB_003094900 [Plakobranchus ocellatus]|uniref:Uncharacterized protein n=1 Tax=Plakobranchus ocellatus TaxID=259542 RepID=A0AAV4A9T8_9GAST|nr:hypothetical protein PoB_003094900 [Plakobranchus ocellatus]
MEGFVTRLLTKEMLMKGEITNEISDFDNTNKWRAQELSHFDVFLPVTRSTVYMGGCKMPWWLWFGETEEGWRGRGWKE